MSKQITINSSFFAKIEKLEEDTERKAKDKLKQIAKFATDISPVDTAAYVESFAFVQAGAGGGRSRTSNNKPTGQNGEAARAESYATLLGDIDRLDFDAAPKATLRNRSPHARAVEDGGVNWRKSGYGIFRRVRNAFG